MRAESAGGPRRLPGSGAAACAAEPGPAAWGGRLVGERASARALLARYELLEHLSRGAFGEVFAVREKSGSFSERVVKVCATRDLSARMQEAVRREVQLLRRLDHPNIVKIFEFAYDSQQMVIVLERLGGGDCGDLLRRHGPLSEAAAARLLRQVLSAAAYCHAQRIVHRDIKPENVMVVRREQRSWHFHAPLDCKVIDFGLAALDGVACRGDVSGTPAYMAPEVVDRAQVPGPKADVWSVGVTAHRLLTGELPFGVPADYEGGTEELFGAIRRFQGVDFEDECWDRCRGSAPRSFVRALMCRSVDSRPSAAEALRESLVDQHCARCARLSRKTLGSLEGFARAPPPVKHCLLLTASRLGEERLVRIRREFIGLDPAGRGSVSFEELQHSVDTACWGRSADVRELFDGLDRNGNGEIEYTEFAAACLYRKLRGRGGEQIAQQAVGVLDDDADGLIRAAQVRALFPEGEGLSLLDQLPQDRAFGAREFHRCLLRAADAAGGPAEPPRATCSWLVCGEVPTRSAPALACAVSDSSASRGDSGGSGSESDGGPA